MKILLAAALLPALVLLIFVFKQDKIEKEPFGLLLTLLFLGAFSCVPASILESLFVNILESFVPSYTLTYVFIETFIIVAIAEEGCKLFFLKLKTWNNPAFNYTFDGIVYAVFVGLGFAGLENVMYVTQLGLSVAIGRGLLSIPGHCTFAIIMGLYYSRAKYFERNGSYKKARSNLTAAFLYPVLLHGFYDFCLMTGSDTLTYIFFAFVVVVDIAAFVIVKNQSKNDQLI